MTIPTHGTASDASNNTSNNRTNAISHDVPNDISIAQYASLQPITAIAQKLGLSPEQIEPYGHYKAKINPTDVFASPAKSKQSKLILVTAINPTPAGEGKTTGTIGLTDA